MQELFGVTITRDYKPLKAARQFLDHAFVSAEAARLAYLISKRHIDTMHAVRIVLTEEGYPEFLQDWRRVVDALNTVPYRPATEQAMHAAGLEFTPAVLQEFERFTRHWLIPEDAEPILEAVINSPGVMFNLERHGDIHPVTAAHHLQTAGLDELASDWLDRYPWSSY